MKKFWIVAKNQQDLISNRRHTTLAEAMAEAERLAVKRRGEFDDFLVFECIGKFGPEKPQVVWNAATTDEG